MEICQDDNSDYQVLDKRYENELSRYLRSTFRLSDVDDLLADFFSQDLLLKHRGAIGLGILLTNQMAPELCRQVCDAQIIPVAFKYFQQNQFPHLKLEAALIIANISHQDSGQLYNQAYIELLISTLTEQKHESILNHTLAALTLFVMNSARERDFALRLNIAPRLLSYMKQNLQRESLLPNIVEVLKYLCLVKPYPPLKQVKEAIEYFFQCIRDKKIYNANALLFIYEIFFVLADNNNLEVLQLIKNEYVIKQIVNHLTIYNEDQVQRQLFSCLLRLVRTITLHEVAQRGEFSAILIRQRFLEVIQIKFDQFRLRDWRYLYQICYSMSHFSNEATKIIENYNFLHQLLKKLAQPHNESVVIFIQTLQQFIENVNFHTVYKFLSSQKTMTNLLKILSLKDEDEDICAILKLIIKMFHLQFNIKNNYQSNAIKKNSKFTKIEKNNKFLQFFKMQKAFKVFEKLKSNSDEQIMEYLCRIQFLLH